MNWKVQIFDRQSDQLLFETSPSLMPPPRVGEECVIPSRAHKGIAKTVKVESVQINYLSSTYKIYSNFVQDGKGG